ncbi:MAG: InlB B-repeat-containing protein [Bacteroidetes bacterium]|nr:InlB B-repeat-containing protein [Bacteroidota bacterium]
MKTSRLSNAVIKAANAIRAVIIAAIIIVAICSCLLNAAYLQNIPQTITQPDGSVVNCFASGDEFYNYLHDADGYTIVKDPETGFYVYADKVGSDLISTDLVVGKGRPQSRGLQTELLHSQEYIANKRANLLDATALPQSNQKQHNSFQGPSPFDTINQIVILVTWNNGPSFYYPLSYYDTVYNHGSNSFKSYWKELSYNQLTVNTHLYQYKSPYTRNSITSGATCYGAFIKDIITNVANNVPQNLKIDCNGDGFVDNISVILQGVPVGWNNIIWPHSVGDHSFLNGMTGWGLGYSSANCNGYYTTTNPTYKFGPIRGKYLNTFNLNFEFGNNPSGGGVPPNMLDVLCHEFFHTFGAPDLYVNTGINRVGNWSLMSNGGNYVTMYERQKYGLWLDSIPTISANGTYTLQHCKQNVTKNAYKINCTTDPNYFFVLELRNLNKEFNTSKLTTYPSENTGVLIYRINKNRSGKGNYYGDSSGTKGEMYVYRAGGTNSVAGSINKALYNNVYTHNSVIRNTITDNTTNLTTSFLENGSASGLYISNISVHSSGDSVSFVVGAYSSTPKYTLLVSASKGGTVSTNPSNLTSLDSGTSVTLTAVASTGYKFINWTRKGANTTISSNNPYIFNITKNDSLFANFSPVEWTITYNLNGGSGIMSPTIYTIETPTITLPTPTKTGYNFAGWYNNSGLTGTPITSINQGSTGNKVFYAKWDTTITSNQFTLTLLASPSNSGNVIGGGVYNSGSITRVSAMPNAGYRFVKWTKNNVDYSLIPNMTIIVNSDITLVAHFISLNPVPKYQVSVNITPSGAGSVIGSGQYDSNTTCQLVATSNSNYQFVGYYLNNALVSSNSNYNFIVNNDANYEAKFELKPVPKYQVSVNVTPSGAGSVVGAGQYDSNTTCQLVATPNSNYQFVGYYLNNIMVSNNPNYSFTVNKNANYEAKFVLNSSTAKYQISVDIIPGNGGSVVGAGQYDSNTICQLIATPNPNYVFAGYYLNNFLISSNPNYTFIVNKDANYEARFRKFISYSFEENIKSATLSVTPNPTSEEFKISLDIVKTANIHIILLDLSGREVLYICDNNVSAGTFTKTIKTDNLPKGIYFLRLSVEGNIIVKKIVVN